MINTKLELLLIISAIIVGMACQILAAILVYMYKPKKRRTHVKMVKMVTNVKLSKEENKICKPKRS